MSVGITERGDPALDFRWENQINNHVFCVLITKQLNDTFINKVLKYKSKVILHITCTGWGNTSLEPGAYSPEKTFSQFLKLVDQGFPISQIVLRLDPVIPNDLGIEKAKKVLDLFRDSGLKRVRFSFIDRWNKIVPIMAQRGYPFEWDTFDPPQENMEIFMKLASCYSNFVFESCAEDFGIRVGCVSEKDFEILGLPVPELTPRNSKSRSKCLCCSEKTELLLPEKACGINCGYCFLQESK